MKYYRKLTGIIGTQKTIIAISAFVLVAASPLVSVIASAANDLQQSVSGISATHTISGLPKELTVKERTARKGQAIAALGHIPKERQGRYFIEVVRMEPIEGGVQVFVRAWDVDNQPIGFGNDGTVEIERFRFFNPPILVEDAGGDITRTWVDETTGASHTLWFREDPKEALLQSLEHTIVVKKEKFGSGRIIKEKIGNTTDIFYPSSEGSIYSVPNATWSGARAATTGTLRDGVVQVNYDGGYLVERAFFNFETFALPDTDTIDSAIISFKGTGTNFGSPTANIYFSAASDVIVADDLDLVSSTEYCDTPITSWSASAYNDFALNAAGITAISKTGLTKTSLRVANYDGDNAPPAALHKFHFLLADEVGTTNDPNLVVEHSAVASGAATPTGLLLNALANPSNVATTSPYFSAIYTNASTTAFATSYQIQVATSSSYWGAPYWDSGVLALSSSTPVGMRTPNIFSAPVFMLDGLTYYWRIRLRDQGGNLGDWSTTTTSFTMTAPPALVATGHGSGTGNFSVTVNTALSGNNRLLVCGLYVQSSKDPVGVSAKWNDTEMMTKLSALSLEWSTTVNANVYYFYLLGGTSGNHDVDFTVTGAGPAFGISDYATCASYVGVEQTGQPSTSAMHTETGVQFLSTSNKTTYPGSVLIGFTFFNGGNTSAPTAGPGTMLRDFTDTTNWYGVLSDNGSNILSVANPSLNINRPTSGNMATLQASWSPVHD